MTEDRIGKFEIISRIGAGGMADVYCCRLRGMGGFEKVVVVKRIRPERATDPAFVNMFLDEARLAASLDHPNIVQVFDVGEVDGSPYIAMEYVKGPTLSALIREAQRREKVCPSRMVRIISGVCEGLHHAHTARGQQGEPLGLVHRDVSPQNIIVSREGVPKLLDFGVAKATGRLTESLAGTLKGKLRYMPPERLSGIVDQRGDIFSLGVCLFEATTGQNPYGPPGTDEVALLGSIASGKQVRPSEVMPGYPRALEEIVLWAIERDVSRRCPSARALQERLEDLVSRPPYQTSARAVASWVQELFPDIEESGPKKIVGPAPSRPPAPARPPAPRRRRAISPFNPLAAVLSPDTGSELDVVTRAARPAVAAAPPARRQQLWVAVAVVLAAGASSLALYRRYSATPTSGAVAPAGSSAPAAGVATPPPAPLRPQQPSVAQAPPSAAIPRAADPSSAAAPPRARKRTKNREASRWEEPTRDEPGRDETAKDETAKDETAKAPGPRLALAAPSPARAPASAERPAPVGQPAPVRQPAPTERRGPSRETLDPTLSGSPTEQAQRPAGTYSARPLSPVPPPKLPRVHRASGAEDLVRLLRRVEDEAIRAGCSPAYARGITAPLAQRLAAQGTPEIYPASLYYLIVREAALGREKEAAGRELASAHRSGLVKALTRLPIAQR